MLRKCDVISKAREVVHLIDENGCIIDDLLLDSLKYSKDKLEITAETKIFKFIDESELRFTCNIVLVPKNNPQTHIQVNYGKQIGKGVKRSIFSFQNVPFLVMNFANVLLKKLVQHFILIKATNFIEVTHQG